MKRLAIISTHPIQYNAPLFALLHQRAKISIKVFYTWGEKVLEKKYDPGFAKIIEWDIPLLEGYEYCFVKNVSRDPGSHHFKGIDNPTLIDEIKAWSAEAVLVYGWSFKSHLKVLRYFHKKMPVFFRGDSTLIGESNQLKKLLRSLFLKWVYSKVDKALYVGTHNKNYYLKFGMKEEQLVLVPHAIDNKRFSPNTNNKNSSDTLKKSIGLKLEELVFLFAGKLEHKKNVELLIESFKKINKTKINLVIVGNGKLERELKESSATFKNIFFLNFQNQILMPVIYQMTDVFVLPSKGHDETWGLSINEAMASGKAILVSDACGAAMDLVQNGVNGYTFQSENLDDLREKMLKLINNKNDLNKMGESSLSIIRNWNYEKDCVAIEKLLNRTEYPGKIMRTEN